VCPYSGARHATVKIVNKGFVLVQWVETHKKVERIFTVEEIRPVEGS
jgi:hypothetical protein